MTPDTRRPGRTGWPWPAEPKHSLQEDSGLGESEALVNATALAVARWTNELRLALQQLEEAQTETRVASECIATREAERVIAQARRRLD